MHWYDFLLFGIAVIGAACYGYLEGHRSGFLKGVRAAERARLKKCGDDSAGRLCGDMRRKADELWTGNPPRMGNAAIALMLGGYADRLDAFDDSEEKGGKA